MRDLRWVARIVAGAGFTVTIGTAGNQIIDEHQLSWEAAYLTLGVAVLAAIFSERPSAVDPTAGGVLRGRRSDYLRRVQASVEKLEIVGIATQNEFVLRMRQVYVDVSVIRKPLHDTAHESVLEAPATPPGEGKRQTLQSFLDDDESRVLAVIGGPGSGKTTLVRNTALSLCERSWRFWRRRPLPVLLYLRDHSAKITSEEPPTLGALAASAGWLNGKIPGTWLEKHLHRGGCVVLLDGLDEVSGEQARAQVVTWVKQQMHRDPKNRYVITSRPHGYESRPLANAEVLQVRRFTHKQIAAFLHGWYYAVECRAQGATGDRVKADADSKAEDLLSRLRAQPALYDLAANPLLLTMIANVHRFRDKLPGSRAGLYAEMCDVLVHRRYEARGLTDATGLRGPQKERVLRHLALTMMRERLRDIPVEEACSEIAETLSNVSAEVSPATFLAEVGKSGLLVEHKQGFYAFAHLTLQEYMAAAQIGQQHSELLTGHVDDPWWRETTLLWVAGDNTDATPVVTACLRSGTVRALALAFDCADEAVEVAHGARRQLEEVLASQNGDEDRHRLINGIAAARSLREVAPLDGDAVLCKRPVPRHLYARFLHDERAAGRYGPDDYAGEADQDDTPAVGMWADDAARFVSWLNSLFDDGTTYRLPTPDELADAAADLLQHTAWACTPSASRPHLHQSNDAPWPYELDPVQLRQYPTADRERTSPYLRLALAPASGSNHVLTDSRVIAYALKRAPEFDDNPALRPLKLVLNLALARTLARTRALAHAHDRARTRDLAHALDRDLGRTRDLAHDLDGTLSRDLERARARAIALAPTRERALERDLDLAIDHAIDRAITSPFPRSRDHDLARALERARALDPDLGPDLGPDLDPDLDRTHGHALDVALARDLARDLDLAIDLDLDLDRALDIDPDRGRARALYLAFALAHDLDHDRTHARTHASDLDRDLDRALDRARDLAPDEQLEMSVAAFRSLLALWEPPATRTKDGEMLTHFDAFLAQIPPERPGTTARASESPATSLRQARELINAHQHAADAPVPNQGRSLDDITSLAAAILDRTAPCEPATRACARIGLLAAMALMHEEQRRDVAALLEEAWCGLVALERRAGGEVPPSEVLLLVRG